jgi:hypothetical protein
MAASSTIRQYRTIAYIVGAVIAFWLVVKVWRFGGGGGRGGEYHPPSPGEMGYGE